MQYFKGDPSWHVSVAPNGVYFRNYSSNVGVIRPNLIDEMVSLPQDAKLRTNDFFVDATGELTILTSQGTVCRGSKKIDLASGQMDNGCFSRLKQMYSDHFLVAEFDEKIRRNRIFLLKNKAFCLAGEGLCLETADSQHVTQIRLIAPRTNVHFFLMTASKLVYTCGVYLDTIQLISRQDFDCMKDIYFMNHLESNVWLVGAGDTFYTFTIRLPVEL